MTVEQTPGVAVDRTRDPRLLDLLSSRTPASVTDVQWARPLRISAFVGAAPLPDDLVMSVRCLVLVGDEVLLCTTVEGRSHAWPGGHRLPGESFAETAAREVHEETGWLLDPAAVDEIGFLHLHNVGEPLEGYPHPDTLQAVLVASATGRSAMDWTDVEGYEVSSRLVPLGTAADLVSPEEPMCLPFLRHIDRTRR